MKYTILVLFFITLYNTNSCANKNTISANKEEKNIQTPDKTKFYINTLNGKDVSEEKLYIVFDEERGLVSGYSGCNTFSCKYTLDKDSISFGFPMTTKMYCEKKESLEQDFFKALIETKIKIIKEDSLLLKTSDNTTLFSGVKSKN